MFIGQVNTGKGSSRRMLIMLGYGYVRVEDTISPQSLTSGNYSDRPYLDFKDKLIMKCL